MNQVAKFSQPDDSDDPRYFVRFLEIVESFPESRDVRDRSYQRMGINSGAHVLDVGCGIGTAASEMAELIGPGGAACGMDVSEAMLEEASARTAPGLNVSFFKGDACALPPGDATFDAVRMERVLLYIPDRAKAISEMMRVTKPGGRVVVTDVDFDCTAIASKDRALTRKMTSLIAQSCLHPTSARELPALLRAAGLSDVTFEVVAVSSPYEFCVYFARGALRAAVQAGKVSAAEVERWFRGLEHLQAAGDFLQLWFFVIASGTVKAR